MWKVCCLFPKTSLLFGGVRCLEVSVKGGFTVYYLHLIICKKCLSTIRLNPKHNRDNLNGIWERSRSDYRFVPYDFFKTLI